MIKVALPDLGEGIEKATVTYWFIQEGEKAKEKEDLVELSTDKATFNLPSPCSGTVIEIFFREGDSVNVGDALAAIEEE